MTRPLPLLLVVALFVTACSVAPSDVTLYHVAQPTQDLAQDEAAIDAQADQATQASSARTEPVIVGASDEIPRESSDASAIPESEASPKSVARLAFEALASSAVEELRRSEGYEVSFSRSFHEPGVFDLSSHAWVSIDSADAADDSSVQLVGPSWETGAIDGLAELLSQLETSASPEAGRVDSFGNASFVRPVALIDDVRGLLTIDGQVERLGDGRFQLLVAHHDLLALSPGAAVSPWTSAQALGESIVGERTMQGATPVVITFAYGQVTRVEIDYTPLLIDARAAQEEVQFDNVVFIETFELDYKQPTPASPSFVGSAVADPTQIPADQELAGPHQFVVGECYAGPTVLPPGVTPIPCTEPHLFEVTYVGKFDFPDDGPVPEQASLAEGGLPICGQAFQRVTGKAFSSSLVSTRAVGPSGFDWDRGYHDFACFIEFDEPMVLPLSAIDVTRFDGWASRAGLRRGDCLSLDEGEMLTAFLLISCEDIHKSQVIAVVPIDQDGPLPTEQWLRDLASEKCSAALHALSAYDQTSAPWRLWTIRPNERDWNTGWRSMVCIVLNEQTIQGSIVPGF